MEAQTLSAGRKQVWEDRFQWPLALGLLCIVAEMLLPVTRKPMVVSLLAALMLLPLSTVDANDTRDGISAYEKQHFEQALKHFTDAQLNDPDKPEMLYNVANAFYKTGNFEAAAEHYKQVLETDDTQLKRKALYNLGNAEFRRGNAKDALGHYEAALTIDPDDQMTKENLEFVKKVMQEQQQQKTQEGQKDQETGDQSQENESSPDDSQNSQSSQNQDQKQQQQNGARQDQSDGQRDQQRPEFADEMDKQQEQQAAQTNEPGNDNQSTDQPQAAQPGEQTDDFRQAERMLNRLQDQPGRALMPATGKRIVEKDW